MASERIRLRATYNPTQDILHLSAPSCTGKWMDSQDGVFFFTVYNQRTDTQPTGFEIHHFSEVWDDEGLIPQLDVRLDVENTRVERATLRDVLKWAYHQFVARPGERDAGIEYRVSGQQQLAMVREKRQE